MQQQIDLSKIFCLAPWVNIHIDNTSNIKPCCSWKDSFQSIENYTSGTDPKLIKLKQQLLDNLPPPTCQKCTELDWYSQYKQSNITINDLNDFSIESVDVRWGSTCQLSCMYCSEQFSSTWSNIVRKQKNIPIKNYRLEETNTVFDFFSKNSIKRVSMLGGEPLLLKENLRLLDIISDDTSIEIFTNLNIDVSTNELYQRLIKRSNVNWYVSMENIKYKFEFVRRGAVWEQQVTNLDHLISTHPQSISLQSQYCVYSAFDLVDLYQFGSDRNLHVNLVCGNFNIPELDIFSYPQDFKMLALQEVEKCIQLFPDSEFKLAPVKQKLLNDMDTVIPNIVESCIEWHRDRETKFFNNRFEFSKLWTQFDKISC